MDTILAYFTDLFHKIDLYRFLNDVLLQIEGYYNFILQKTNMNKIHHFSDKLEGSK